MKFSEKLFHRKSVNGCFLITTFTPFYKNKLYKNNEAEFGKKKEQIKNIWRPRGSKTKN